MTSKENDISNFCVSKSGYCYPGKDKISSDWYERNLNVRNPNYSLFDPCRLIKPTGGRSGRQKCVAHQNWCMIYTFKVNYYIIWMSRTEIYTLPKNLRHKVLLSSTFVVFFLILSQIKQRSLQPLDPHLMFFHTRVLERNCTGSFKSLYVIGSSA